MKKTELSAALIEVVDKYFSARKVAELETIERRINDLKTRTDDNSRRYLKDLLKWHLGHLGMAESEIKNELRKLGVAA